MSSPRPNQPKQENNEQDDSKINNIRYVHDDHHDIPVVSTFGMLRSDFNSSSATKYFSFYSFPTKYIEKKHEQEESVSASPNRTPVNHL